LAGNTVKALQEAEHLRPMRGLRQRKMMQAFAILT
jgi:hypothetical protein